uniref:Uncharacterized protein n=1 Tax=Ovis aries TaxID=9940 RepID=A0AC11BXA3_SHEEP
MRYLSSYLLTALGGNSSLRAKEIKKILDGIGIKADDDQLNKVISELNRKNIEDVIAQGIGKLASVPAGGAVAVSAAPGSTALFAGSALAAAEKKEEKKEESKESDDDMGFGLFDKSPTPLQIKSFLCKKKKESQLCTSFPNSVFIS